MGSLGKTTDGGNNHNDVRFQLTPKVGFLHASETDGDFKSCFIHKLRTLEANLSLTSAADTWVTIWEKSSCGLPEKVKSHTMLNSHKKARQLFSKTEKQKAEHFRSLPRSLGEQLNCKHLGLLMGPHLFLAGCAPCCLKISLLYGFGQLSYSCFACPITCLQDTPDGRVTAPCFCRAAPRLWKLGDAHTLGGYGQDLHVLILRGLAEC